MLSVAEIARMRGRDPVDTVLDLIVAHTGDDRAGFFVLRRQRFQMSVQMRLDLTLGLDDKTQAVCVTSTGGNRTHHKSTRVPQRIQHARA